MPKRQRATFGSTRVERERLMLDDACGRRACPKLGRCAHVWHQAARPRMKSGGARTPEIRRREMPEMVLAEALWSALASAWLVSRPQQPSRPD